VEVVQLKHGHKASKDDYTLCLEDEESPTRRLHKESTGVVFTQNSTQEKATTSKRASSKNYEAPIKLEQRHFGNGFSEITKENELASNQYTLTESHDEEHDNSSLACSPEDNFVDQNQANTSRIIGKKNIKKQLPLKTCRDGQATKTF